MINRITTFLLDKRILIFGLVISLSIISCEDKKQKSSDDPSTVDTLVILHNNDSIQIDTITQISPTSWKGPLLLISNNEAAILKTYDSLGDTLSLTDNVNWLKKYLNSDTLISIGRNGVQVQQFFEAIVKNPNGDCNRQVVLTLKHQEIKGLLAAKTFLQSHSIQFFDHQESGKLNFIQNRREQAFYNSIFRINKNSSNFDSHNYYITNDENFIIEKRGKVSRMYNAELEEEHLLYLNDEYRIAYKTQNNWLVSNWSFGLSNMNSPEPIMSCFGNEEILIIWGFSEGMGDYQMKACRIDLSSKIPVFEYGSKMQAYIGLGCD